MKNKKKGSELLWYVNDLNKIKQLIEDMVIEIDDAHRVLDKHEISREEEDKSNPEYTGLELSLAGRIQDLAKRIKKI